MQPRFTARKIFNATTGEALPVIREPGFANLALGAVGAASLLARDFVLPACIAGAVFYGFAGVAHAFRPGGNVRGWVAMATDLFVFSSLP